MSHSVTPKIQVLPQPADVAREAADLVVESCLRALEEKETFTLCLAGGSTPKATYELLAGEAYKGKIDWARVEVFFGDERTVPPDHADSNYAMAKASLLDHVTIPGDNVYRMKGELDPQKAADEYEAMLRDKFDGEAGLDLLLLGMGDDAHTLSLFPHTPALKVTDRLCVANPVVSKDTTRITLTAAFANRSERVAALVTGENKAKALQNVLEGPDDPETYPTQLIAPASGQFIILADAAAVDMDGADEE